ncbi:DUF6318 family protein [Luteipulveratus flavus]|uniref:Uncharacterized protein n=1 Tax=Luteipulveratus flavus TaxID=3031728 RepID=A0ABT6C8G8_9MICO|nr:DUF6318 family protein [Luteipulveratus sp. YIM 133296]MDF8265163.1 hypothetical protein [Luteipulveratus sp. YIM 133296]
MRTAAAAAVLAVACAGALSGCGGDADAGGSPTAPSSSSSTPLATSTSTAVPASSAAPTSSALGPGLPGVPPDARANTEPAAIAFAKHYYDQLNRVRMSPSAGLLDGYGLGTCKPCSGFAANVKKMASSGERNSGPAVRVLDARRLTAERGMIIQVDIDQEPVSVLARDGSVVRSYQSVKGVQTVVFLTWSDGGWRIANIQIGTA